MKTVYYPTFRFNHNFFCHSFSRCNCVVYMLILHIILNTSANICLLMKNITNKPTHSLFELSLHQQLCLHWTLPLSMCHACIFLMQLFNWLYASTLFSVLLQIKQNIKIMNFIGILFVELKEIMEGFIPVLFQPSPLSTMCRYFCVLSLLLLLCQCLLFTIRIFNDSNRSFSMSMLSDLSFFFNNLTM